MQEKVIDVELVNIRPGRIRKKRDADKLASMKQSLETVGILQPIVVEFEGDIPYVVAGETRLLLVRELAKEGKDLRFLGRNVGKGLIPFVDYVTDLTEDERLEVELRENLDRADLTWQEVAEAQKRLYELRSRQGKSLEDVQKELGHSNVTVLREQIEVAARLADPEIRSAPTLREARKIAAKKDEDVFMRALARKLDSTVHEGMIVHEGDTREILAQQVDESYDMILTDPPYGINAQAFGVGLDHTYNDSPAHYKALMQDILPHMWRVLKAQAHMYMFCDIEHFLWLREAVEKVGFSAGRVPIIWHKNRGHIPMSTLGPMRCYEIILFANKGDKPVAVQNRPDVISANIVSDKDHAAQKPVELYTELLQRSAKLGDHILDPFCGSGTIFEAAHMARMKATGIDLDAAKAKLRIEELLNPAQAELL